MVTMSPEWPDLVWGGPPRAFGTGRDGKAPRYCVIHYTAGAERSTSAEDGAAYDRVRTDGVSTHYFHDSSGTVQEVLTRDRANAAFYRGNRLGVQHELCGTAQTRAQWLDEASDATLWWAARQVARDCRKYDLEVRRLSVAEVRAAWYDFPAGPRGICGHVDVTNAYPEDGGTHTDPGPDFPWDVFLDRVRKFHSGGTDEMLMVARNRQDGAAVFVGNGMTCRGVATVSDMDTLIALGAHRIMADFASRATMEAVIGRLEQVTMSSLATRLDELAAKVEALSVGGSGAAGGGMSLDQARSLLFEELPGRLSAPLPSDG